MVNENEVSRQLETLVPLDVYRKLLDFAKENTTTGTGKWDFGNAIRLLLERSNTMEALGELDERIEILELEMTKLKAQSNSQKKESSVATFGGTKHE
jgi:hypothetical protein